MTATVITSVFGDAKNPALVLVHGWGYNSDVWRGLLAALRLHFYVYIIDLPGYSRTCATQKIATQADWSLDNLLKDFFSILPPAIWCGWSLGGMLATRFASIAPERVKGLVTIGSNLLFIEKPDWLTAMPNEEYRLFVAAMNDNTSIALSHFLMLVCHGSQTASADRRVLKKIIGTTLPSLSILKASLTLLTSLDIRSDFSALGVPQYHLLGQHDALVPSAVGAAMSDLNKLANICVVEGAGHAVLISHPDVVINTLLAVAKN